MTPRIVVTAEPGTPTVWQVQLLVWSLRRIGEQAPITVLCAGGPVDVPGATDIFVHRPWRNYGERDYAPFNFLGGLSEWLPTIDDTQLLMLECDMAALGPVPQFDSAPGQVVDQDWSYDHSLTGPQVQAMTALPANLVPGFLPIWIDTIDLRRLLPLWMERTRRLLGQADLPNLWVANMAGWSSACADSGVAQQLVNIDCMPILHYWGHCFDKTFFDKHKYRPWTLLNPPPDNPTAAAFAALIDAYAAHLEATR